MSAIDFGSLLAEADRSGGGAPPPAGEYDTVIETATATKSSGGKPMFKVRFKILTGPQAGRPIFNNFVISAESAGALSFFFQHMAALGLDRDFFAGNPSPEQVAASLVGRQARLTITHRDWNGKPQADVQAVKPATPGIAAPAAAAPAVGAPAPSVAPPVPTATPAAAPAPVTAPAPSAVPPAPAGVPNPGF